MMYIVWVYVGSTNLHVHVLQPLWKIGRYSRIHFQSLQWKANTASSFQPPEAMTINQALVVLIGSKPYNISSMCRSILLTKSFKTEFILVAAHHVIFQPSFRHHAQSTADKCCSEVTFCAVRRVQQMSLPVPHVPRTSRLARARYGHMIVERSTNTNVLTMVSYCILCVNWSSQTCP